MPTPRTLGTMQRHRLISGVGLLTCTLLASSCRSLGPRSESPGALGPSRTLGDRSAIIIDGSGHVPERIEELLLGRFPGVNVTKLSSGGFQVRVRSTSMMGTQEPLWVIDGMPVEPSVSDGVLGSIDPRQVSRIVVLRDAGSTAMYGTRGANGVIEVTTRRGIVTEPAEPRQAPPRIDPPRNDPPRDPDV